MPFRMLRRIRLGSVPTGLTVLSRPRVSGQRGLQGSETGRPSRNCSLVGVGASSGYLAVAHALGKTVGPEAARLLDELFVFPSSGEVEHFFAQGGFSDANVKTPRINAVNSVDEFTRALAVASTIRRTETQFSEETLGLLVAEVAVEMASYVSADGLHFPMEAQMLAVSK